MAYGDCACVVNSKRKEIGMTVRALSKKTGIDENVLGRTLIGKRKMNACELLALVSALNLSFEDFKRGA